MPYILAGKPISPDRAFTHEGIQYPAGWIRRVSEESRQAIGLYWEADPPQHDQRFWWGYTQDGELIPKDLDQLKENWISQVKHNAGQRLAASDWVIIRSQDPSSGCEPSSEVLAERALIREKSNSKEQAILEFTNVPDLAAYLTSSDFYYWTEKPPIETDEFTLISEDPIIISDDVDSDEDPILVSTGTSAGIFSGGYVSDAGVDSVSFDV